MSWLLSLEPWLAYLIIGLLITAKMGFAAVILVRAGRSPLWVFLLLFPILEAVAVWLLAFARWPRRDPEPGAGPPA